MQTSTTFNDIDFSFSSNPVRGDLNEKINENAIKQSIKNLILTHNYEVPFHPEIGSSIHSLLFDLNTPINKIAIQKNIVYTITNFEPRVKLINVEVNNSDEYSLNINIKFQIVNTEATYSYKFDVFRTR